NARAAEGERDVQERAQGSGAEVPGRLNLTSVNPVDAGEHGQDEVRDVAVDEREDDRVGIAVQPVRWMGDPDRLQHLVDVAVRGQKADPGEHAQQVADPEGDHEQNDQQDLGPAGVAGDVVGHRVADG